MNVQFHQHFLLCEAMFNNHFAVFLEEVINICSVESLYPYHRSCSTMFYLRLTFRRYMPKFHVHKLLQMRAFLVREWKILRISRSDYLCLTSSSFTSFGRAHGPPRSFISPLAYLFIPSRSRLIVGSGIPNCFDARLNPIPASMQARHLRISSTDNDENKA